MDNFFTSVFGERDPEAFLAQQISAVQDFFDPQAAAQNSAESRGPPPASGKAIRQLPTITVTPEDLVDENNRECCICLEENHLKDRVVRLPCAHIFHQRCIHDWLTKHCTCPVCRYELETDDPQYERARKQRMASRKPRVHSYVLDRMSKEELRQMAKHLKVRMPPWMRKKQDLMDALIKSGKIDIIAAPKPVEHALSDLRSMGVGQLRRTMADAGVFFDPIDVVEKEDMVRIFCNSGRLVPIPEPVVDVTGEVAEDPKDASSNSNDEIQISLPNSNSVPDFHIGETNMDGINSGNVPLVETVAEESSQPTPYESATDMFPGVVTDSETVTGDRGVIEEEQTVLTEEEKDEMYDPPETEMEPMEVDEEEAGPPAPVGEIQEEDFTEEQAYERLEKCSISELRTTARRLGADLSDCLEKQEMIEKLVAAGAGRPFGPADFDQWSVSEIRAIATAVDVDLSNCADRDSMVRKLAAGAELRPRVASYLGALVPLVHLSIPQLRAVARDWRVSINGCLEKEEMIQRLLASGGPSAR